jgi:hypothetical protein
MGVVVPHLKTRSLARCGFVGIKAIGVPNIAPVFADIGKDVLSQEKFFSLRCMG